MRKWLKVSLTLADVLVEPVTDYLIGIVGAGTEVRAEGHVHGKTLNGYLGEEGLSVREIRHIVGQLERYCAELADIFTVPVPVVRWKFIDDQDWGQQWKKYFSPFAVTNNIMITPSWQRCRVGDGQKVIVMDPGMAFGTGHHATTALVIQLLESLTLKEVEITSALDVGTGTGILGMAAALCGVKKVTAIDNDPVAVNVAGENIKKNNLCRIMEVSGEDLAVVNDSYQLVLANIVHDVLVEMAADLNRLTAIGGWLILSGILQGEQENSITAAFTNRGFNRGALRKKDGWVALLFTRKN